MRTAGAANRHRALEHSRGRVYPPANGADALRGVRSEAPAWTCLVACLSVRDYAKVSGMPSSHAK
jgi:hypothetical protein